MRKNIFGRRLKRDKNERKSLFKGLLSSLVLKERIQTTEAKAKAIKGEADKLVTKALKETNLARRLLSDLLIPEAVEKILSDIAPRFKDRKGGYTRTVRLGKRFGDDAPMVMLEWVETRKIEEVKTKEKDLKPKKPTSKPKKIKKGKKPSTKQNPEKTKTKIVKKTKTKSK